VENTSLESSRKPVHDKQGVKNTKMDDQNKETSIVDDLWTESQDRLSKNKNATKKLNLGTKRPNLQQILNIKKANFTSINTENKSEKIDDEISVEVIDEVEVDFTAFSKFEEKKDNLTEQEKMYPPTFAIEDYDKNKTLSSSKIDKDSINMIGI
jgi:hypothetical protein